MLNVGRSTSQGNLVSLWWLCISLPAPPQRRCYGIYTVLSMSSFIVVAGDFNHANFKTVLPKFHQHAHFPTKVKSEDIGLVVRKYQRGLQSGPPPGQLKSYICDAPVFPAYRSVLKHSKTLQKQIRDLNLWLVT